MPSFLNGKQEEMLKILICPRVCQKWIPDLKSLNYKEPSNFILFYIGTLIVPTKKLHLYYIYEYNLFIGLYLYPYIIVYMAVLVWCLYNLTGFSKVYIASLS